MTEIFGHDATIHSFLTAMRGDRLHHAWLLTGPEGVGKATVALKLAAKLLASAVDKSVENDTLSLPADHATQKLLDAGSHPDFRLLERLPKDEKSRDKGKTGASERVELARNINVDQIRRLNASFATTPSLSRCRVVVINAVDHLERGAANALLKTLEEPPKGTIFLLISHAPGRLLPTIRSRCRTLRFAPLSDEAMTSFLKLRMPDLDLEARNALISSAQGAPGRAFQAAGLGVAELDTALWALADTGDPSNYIRSQISKTLAGKSAQDRYEYFLSRVPQFIASATKSRQGDKLEQAIDAWEAARQLAQNAVQASLDQQAVVFALAGYVAALAPTSGVAKA